MAFDAWKKLLYGITKGDCILFLGPDLPLVLDDGTRQSPSGELARRLAGALTPGAGDDADRDAGDLSRIVRRFLNEKDAFELEMLLTEWHDSLAGQRSKLHDDLAALPFRHLVTSAHDPLMETALRAAGKSPNVERYHYKGRNNERIADPAESAPLLFHLYGNVSEPDSVVLSETHLLDFLSRLIGRDPPLPRYVDAQLTTGRLFLFLGFGLRQWYLRILLHVLKVLRQGCVAFAIEPLDAEDGEPSQDTILFYQDNYKVEIQQQDVVQFVETLRSKYVPPSAPSAESSGTAPAGPVENGAEAPSVFICHAGENKDAAREVHEALERSGLRPWLDKEALRGGERWDQVIESTIEDASYFVVLNSRELLAKTRNPRGEYVNREIKAALDGSRDRFTNFIFPVLIDDAPLFEPLKDFQAIDLRAQDVRELVRAIKREAGKVL